MTPDPQARTPDAGAAVDEAIRERQGAEAALASLDLLWRLAKDEGEGAALVADVDRAHDHIRSLLTAEREPGEAPALTRHEDGAVSLSWPFGRPRVTSCTPEALEGMVEQHNTLTADLAAARSALEVSESWRDRNAELAETFRDQRDAARSALARVEAEHQPVVAESTTPGVWNVYCDACSQTAHDYIYPCRNGHEFPPRQLRAAIAHSPAEPAPEPLRPAPDYFDIVGRNRVVARWAVPPSPAADEGVVKCHATVSIDLVRDDDEGPVPHPFPCSRLAGHHPEHPHEALVTWFSGEDDD